MKVTGLIIFALFGMASAGKIGDGDSTHVQVTTRQFGVAALILDGQGYFMLNCIIIAQGYRIPVGEFGVITVLSGFFTTEDGHRLRVDGGLLYGHSHHPRNTEAIRSALSRTDITLEHFIQQTGANSPKMVIEVTAGAFIFNGIYRNVNAAVVFILMSDLTEPNIKMGPATSDQFTDLIRTFVFAAIKLEGHTYIFQNGEILLQGSPIEIGEDGVFAVVSGSLTTDTGISVTVDGGFLYVHVLHPRNTQAIRSALSQADITLEDFLQQTRGSSPNKVFEVTAGVLSISGTYRNVNAAVIFHLMDVTEPGTGQTVVTERAAPETLTVTQPVTLTKTSTLDEYITITSPVYNSAVATSTNFLKRTVTVTEEQVIRSPVAGNVVVKTIPVSTESVMTVTDTATNYFVSTALETVTSTLQHFAPNFYFSTITVNNIITSTVVHTITRTSIATAYVTNAVGSTVYSTISITVPISHGPATVTPVPVYY